MPQSALAVALPSSNAPCRRKPKKPPPRRTPPPAHLMGTDVVDLTKNGAWQWDPAPRRRGWYAIIQVVEGTGVPGIAYNTGTKWICNQRPGPVEASIGPFATFKRAHTSLPYLTED